MKKVNVKTKGIISILVALLFLVPSVTAFNAGNGISANEVPEAANEPVELMETAKDVDFDINLDNELVTRSDPGIQQNVGIVKDGKMISPISYREIAIIDPRGHRQEDAQTLGSSSSELKSKSTVTAGSETDPTTSTGTAGTRSSSRQDNYDLELRNIAYDEQNTGWCGLYDIDPADAPDGTESYWWDGNQGYLGSFFVGTTTTITATIKNNGAVTVTNINVNFTIYDYTTLNFESEIRWGIKCPETKTIASLTAQQTQTVSIDWAPPFASEFLVFAEIESMDSEDPEYSNNGYGLYTRVAIWQDDIEGGAGSWTHSASTGADNWHISNSVANPSGDHTTPNAWYEGGTDSPAVGTYPADNYDNNNILTLTSPAMDFGDIITKTTTDGDLYVDYIASYACLLTGNTEVNSQNINDFDMTECDVMWFHEISTDGSNWEEINLGYNIVGFTGTRFTLTSYGGILYFNNPVWSTEWYPVPAYLTSDGTSYFYNPGSVLNLNVTSWNNIKFRIRFETDADTSNQLGFYLDDFITWGVQNWKVPMDVRVTEFSVPSVSGTPIIHPNEAATFSTKIENKPGAAQKTFNAVLKIKDINNPSDIETQQKSVTLAVDEENTQQWSWTPDAAGDYLLTITAGDRSDDYYWLDNEESRVVRVRESTDEILVVDDDNSDFTTNEVGHWYMDVCGKMCAALDDVEIAYDVYHVGSNESGPSKTLMEDYNTVIWLTGMDNQFDIFYWKENYQTHPNIADWDISLRTDDITQLEMYLNLNDHNLWLISPTYIYDQYGTSQKTTGTSDFARQYLHVWACQGNVTVETGGSIVTRGTPDPLDGILDTLSADKDGTVSYATYETEPPQRFSDKGSTLEGVPNEDATNEIFYQNAEHTAYNGISYAGDSANRYKTVFLSFNFYLLSDPVHRADMVDKVLTFFGMMGGVEMELVDSSSTKYVNPSGEVSFQFKVTNVGKKTDTMTMSAEISSPTSAPKSEWPAYRIEIGGISKETVDVPGTSSTTNYKDNIYLMITAPDWEKTAAKWNTEYSFTVTAESEKTGNTSYAVVKTIINLYANVTVWYTPQNYKEIKVDESWECYINIKNSTNGDDNYDISLKIDGTGKDLAYFAENNLKTHTVILTPNTARQVIVKIKAGDHELAGYHNITVEVKGTSTQIVHDSSTIATKVKQFHEIAMNSTDVTRVIVDPNDIVGDTITETFTVKIFNHGNGYDRVQLSVESHDEYEVEEDWLEAVEISLDGTELETEFDDIDTILTTTDPVTVNPYDESNDPEYGEEEVTVTININISVEHGEYWFNFIAESEVGLDDEEDPENNNITLMIKVIKPDLIFSPEDLNGTTYDEYPDRTIDNYKFIDDVYEEPLPWDDFEELYLITLDHRTDRDESKGTYGKEMTFSIELAINNIGDSPANLEAVLQTITINVTHEEEDDFGDYVVIDDITLYPVSPTEVEIQPGQNATITFETFTVEWMDPGQDTDIIHTFTVTIDSKAFIIEQNEGNNEDYFELTVTHLKKPKDPSKGSPGFELVILLGAILIVALAGLQRKRLYKRK